MRNSAPVDKVRAWPSWLRWMAVAAQAVIALNFLDLAIRLGLDLIAPGESERVPLPFLAKRIVFLAAVPGAVWLVASALSRATATFTETQLVIAQGGTRSEIPLGAIARVVPWTLPLPEAGFALVLESGRKFALGLSAADPAGMASRIARAPVEHRTFRDAAARRSMRWLHHPLVKLVLVPAALTFILFRLQQLITYGGLTGEWQLYGLRRWLKTLAGVAIYAFGNIFIFAAAWRWIVELLAQPASLLAAPAARRSRIALECIAALGFYGPLIAALVLRWD